MKNTFLRFSAVLLAISVLICISSCQITVTPEYLANEDTFGEISSPVSEASDIAVSSQAETVEPEKATTLKELVKKWDSFYHYGHCCQTSSPPSDVYIEGHDYISNYNNYSIWALLCCDSKEAVKEHTSLYIANSVFATLDIFDPSHFFPYRTSMLCFFAEKATTLFDANTISIISNSGGETKFTVLLKDSKSRVSVAKATLTAEMQDGGYVITNFSVDEY